MFRNSEWAVLSSGLKVQRFFSLGDISLGSDNGKSHLANTCFQSPTIEDISFKEQGEMEEATSGYVFHKSSRGVS